MRTLKLLIFCSELVTECGHRIIDINIKFQCLYVNLDGIFFTSSVDNLISSKGIFNLSQEISEISL